MINRHAIHEIHVPGQRLGRHVHHDEASRAYAAAKASVLQSVQHNATGLPLDQDKPKPWGSCTANALCGSLNSDPNHTGRTYTEADAFHLYQVEVGLEGGSCPPDDPGGSGLMVCKAAIKLGMITSYQHAFGIKHALLALVKRPIIVGVSWFTSFDTPDKNGLVEISPGATVRGGHEFLIDGMVVPAGVTAGNVLEHLDEIELDPWNSWGKAYGVGGRFKMTAATLNQLLHQHGDVTVPIP